MNGGRGQYGHKVKQKRNVSKFLAISTKICANWSAPRGQGQQQAGPPPSPRTSPSPRTEKKTRIQEGESVPSFEKGKSARKPCLCPGEKYIDVQENFEFHMRIIWKAPLHFSAQIDGRGTKLEDTRIFHKT